MWMIVMVGNYYSLSFSARQNLGVNQRPPLATVLVLVLLAPATMEEKRNVTRRRAAGWQIKQTVALQRRAVS